MLCQTILLPITILVTLILPIVRQIVTTVCNWVSSVITIIVKVVSEVCSWLPWPLDSFCDWVTSFIKVLQTVWNWVCNTVITTFFDVITYLVNLVIYLVRVVCIIVTIIIGLPGFLLCILGLSLPKRISICIKILTNDDDVSGVTDLGVASSIRQMRSVFKQCNISVNVSGIERVVAPDLLTSTDDSGSSLFSGWHSWFSQHACSCCNQITVFFVDDIQGSANGYTFWGDNWCRVSAGANTDPTIMAHEIGHLCNLWHDDDNANLMYPDSGPPTNPRDKLTSFQCCTMRLSTFVIAGVS